MSQPSQDITSLTQEAQVTLACVPPLVWITWDTFIHFDKEIDCIWRRSKSWVTWLYVFVRYAPMLHEIIIHPLFTIQFTDDKCRQFIAYEFGFMLGLTILVETILLMRIFALYSENKSLSRLLLALFAADIVVSITMLAYVVPKQTFDQNCKIETSPKMFVGYWLSSLIFETVLFVLTLLKFFRNSYMMRDSKSILYVFFRDGTWAFAIIFACMLVNTVMYQVAGDSRAGAAYAWMCSVLSLTGSHILLNIRQLGVHPRGHLSTAEQLGSIVWGPSPIIRSRNGETTGRTDESDTEVYLTSPSVAEANGA